MRINYFATKIILRLCHRDMIFSLSSTRREEKKENKISKDSVLKELLMLYMYISQLDSDTVS